MVCSIILRKLEMEVPPKIPDLPAKIVPLEVLTGGQTSDRGTAADSRPIHPLSALVLIAVDSLWAIFEWVPPVWLVAIPLCFLVVFVPVFLVQKHLKKDANGRAAAFATLLGVLAAIPTPITGTSVG